MRAAFGPPSLFVGSYFISLSRRALVRRPHLPLSPQVNHFPQSPGARSARLAPRFARGAVAPAGLLRNPVPHSGKHLARRRGLERLTHLPLSPSPLKGGGGTWLEGRGSSSTPPLLPGEERAGVRRGGRSIFCQNDLEHSVQIVRHIAVPEADDAPAACLQHAGTGGVARDGDRMVAAVDFDHELAGWNGEVRDVASDRVLAPDPYRERHCPQGAPENSLRLRAFLRSVRARRVLLSWHYPLYRAQPNSHFARSSGTFSSNPPPELIISLNGGRSLRSLAYALRARRSRAVRAAVQPGPDHGRAPRRLPRVRRPTHLPLTPSPLKGGGGTWLRGRSPSAYSPSPPLGGGEGRGEEGGAPNWPDHGAVHGAGGVGQGRGRRRGGRRTMPNESGRNTTGTPRGRSTVERLPASVREAVDAAIADGASIHGITALIRENGGKCSRSAVGRYAKRSRGPEPPAGRGRPAPRVLEEEGRSGRRGPETRSFQLVPSHPGESCQKF